MGTDFNMACKTCEKRSYLGYGGKGGSFCLSQEQKFKDLHPGHDITENFSTDYLKIRDDGHLWTDLEGIVWDSDFRDSIFIEHYSYYEAEDLS